MLAYRTQGLGVLHSAFQYTMAAALLWIWRIAACLLYDHSEILYDRIFAYMLVMSIGFGFHFIHAHQRFVYLTHSSRQEIARHTLRQAIFVFSTITIFVSAIKDQTISRTFLFTYFPVLFCALYLTNRHLPWVLSAFAFGNRRKQPTIVIGSPDGIKKYASWLERKSVYGFQTIGFVQLPGSPIQDKSTEAAIPFLGSFCDVEQILNTNYATQLLALEVPSPEEIHYLNELCNRQGVRLLLINNLPEKLDLPLSFMEDDGVQIIAFRPEPLECPINRLIKRALDISLSLPVVLLILPITNLIVYVFQRHQAPGPLFFLQKRTGFCNEEFMICKYRTMYVDHDSEAVQAKVNDSRVFPAGKWLRQHSIDELPQFLNVLKGEMSIVGPRPHLPEHSSWFNNAAMGFKVRAFIKPGITGLAQVEGFRGEVRELQHLKDRIRSDIYYLENWSLSLEWKIILKTARQLILPPKSAY